MADDSEQDLIPVKEPKSSSVPPVPRSIGSDILLLDRHNAAEKRIAEQLSRNELEDQLYKLKNENLELKKTSHKQEDQLKKLSTKISRLKKLEINSSPARKRDLELEEAIEQLQDKVRNLEKNNVTLREKLLVAKQQVITNVRRPNPYHHVSPKVQTGRPRSGISPYMFSASLQTIQRKTTTPLPPYVIQLLEEARNELFALKDQATTQRNEIEVLEQENEILKERLRIKDMEFEEEITILKSQITEGQRQHVQENLDLIRLHRELKQKNSNIVAVQAQYMDAEEKVKLQKGAQDRLVKELEDKSIHLREEQKKSLELFGELQKNKAVLVNLTELQENLKILKKEYDVLKDTNDQLIKSVINQEKDKSSQSYETALKEQIAKLEASQSSEQKVRNDLMDEIRVEKEKYQKLHETYLQLQKEFSIIKSEKDELESKVNILKSEDIDFEELGAALAVLKMKQQSPDVPAITDSQTEKELESKLQKLESDYAAALKELHDVREMLMTQYKLNQDAQAEIKTTTEREIQAKTEFQTKLEEYANLLDLRASKIQKLEKQLNDIAYGAKKFKIEKVHEEMETIETLELNHGENIFEIHIIKFVYSADGLQAIEKNDPSSFITWNFYEFELQSTPVVKGPNPHFGFSANYTVKVDDFFLFFLHKNTTTLELHESLGTDYRTLAACQLNFSELLEMSSGRVHGTEQLISVSENRKGIVYGTVHYWVKLHIPMDEAFKLYKEKFKALKYIQSNKMTTETAIKMLDKPSKIDTSINDLHIRILRCSNLKGRHKDVQPSPFCVYKFYDLADQDTIIIPASNNPEFADHRTFPIFMDFEMEKYLKTENLEFYVFDDNDSDISSYIGKASVPLLSLSQSKPLKEKFQLLKNNETNGTIEVSLYWQHSYQPPTHEVDLPKEITEPIEYPSHIAPVLSISSEDEDTQTTFPVSRPVPKPRQRATMSKPLQTSTPAKDFVDSSSDSSSPEKKLKPKPSSSSSSHETKSSKPPTTPQPAVRKSKVQLSTVDDFIAYGESFLRSPEKRQENVISVSPVKPPRKSSQNSPENTGVKRQELVDDEDTMLEKKHEISFEEISDDDKQALTNSEEESEEDDKFDVHASENQNPKTSPRVNPPAQFSLVINIASLALKPQSTVLMDSSIKMLYVEFGFLDFPMEDLETPVAMPKPVPPNVITFNFEKVFDFSTQENRLKLNQLAKMFDPLVPGASRLKFTVVSEPPTDEEDLECEEVGFAYVDLKEIMDTGKDLIDKNISIYDAKDNETELGSLVVSVRALQVLQLLHETLS